MAKVWVLDTETKGTGAHMVPLEGSRSRAGSQPVPSFGLRRSDAPRAPAPEPPRAPHAFKVIDVRSREVLATDADARTTVDALRRVGSIVDVTVYVWDPERPGWRMLTFGEKRALWDLRERDDVDPPDSDGA